MSYLECSDWTQCTRCGECLVGCPVMRMEREEAKSAITQLIEGELPSRIKMNVLSVLIATITARKNSGHMSLSFSA